jgi:hypothetical protein
MHPSPPRARGRRRIWTCTEQTTLDQNWTVFLQNPRPLLLVRYCSTLHCHLFLFFFESNDNAFYSLQSVFLPLLSLQLILIVASCTTSRFSFPWAFYNLALCFSSHSLDHPRTWPLFSTVIYFSYGNSYQFKSRPFTTALHISHIHTQCIPAHHIQSFSHSFTIHTRVNSNQLSTSKVYHIHTCIVSNLSGAGSHPYVPARHIQPHSFTSCISSYIRTSYTRTQCPIGVKALSFCIIFIASALRFPFRRDGVLAEPRRRSSPDPDASL